MTVIAALQEAARDLAQAAGIQKGTISVSLSVAVRATTQDPELRNQAGQDPRVWEAVDSCLAAASSADADGHYRYLNGILLLCRNLASAPGSGKLAWSATSKSCMNLLTKTLGTPDKTEDVSRVLSTYLQFLANLIMEIGVSEEEAAQRGEPSPFRTLLSMDLANIREFASLIESNPMACLVLLDAGLRNSPATASLLSTSAHPMLAGVLDEVEAWFHDDNHTTYVELVHSIIRTILVSGNASIVLKVFTENPLAPVQALALLKVVDAVFVTLDSEQRVQIPDYAELVRLLHHQFNLTSEQALPFIRIADQKIVEAEPDVVITILWNTLVILLDMLLTIIESNPTLAKPIVLGDDGQIVRELVSLLGESQLHLPKRSKLADLEKQVKDQNTRADRQDYDPKDFPLIKGKIIHLLSVLVEGNKSVQDLMRATHGLELVLSNCIIDLNNPFIREQSIVCVRYLLEGNTENQEFVSKLEAKQAVSEDALEEAGYETELIDGKIALKRRPAPP